MSTSSKKLVVLFLGSILLLVTLAACANADLAATDPTELPAPAVVVSTATVMPTAAVAQTSCADLNTTWGDWPATVQVLDTLIDANETCGDEPLLSKKYAALYTYGTELEGLGNLDEAAVQYLLAFEIDGTRREALNSLKRLESLPEPTPIACTTDQAPLPDPAPAEAANPASFVRMEDNKLMIEDRHFAVWGANYYPRNAPWYRFLAEGDVAEIAEEFAIMDGAGFSTIRIFLRYEILFQCAPEDAIPNEEAFALVDLLFDLADQHDIKLIVTLNDLPDKTFRPLYTDWAHYDNQTVYIVRRYRNESALLAWDVRNEGDIDYGAHPNLDAEFTVVEVIDWLAHITALVREHDPHHLITAGWWGDPLVTEPYVDFLSFHHWEDASKLQDRFSEYAAVATKPLLLQEVGYHSFATAPFDARDEALQALLLAEAVQVSQNNNQLGWLAWTAFDFSPDLGAPENFEHHFGLWRNDLTPKLVVEELFGG